MESSSYLGYETWLPTPPKVEKPRSIYNAASLAFIGDCIYEVRVSILVNPIIFMITLTHY